MNEEKIFCWVCGKRIKGKAIRISDLVYFPYPTYICDNPFCALTIVESKCKIIWVF
ncbi:MAG: hypothetical protein ABIK75_07005 [candidate division WOR-3 bacterium]